MRHMPRCRRLVAVLRRGQTSSRNGGDAMTRHTYTLFDTLAAAAVLLWLLLH